MSSLVFVEGWAGSGKSVLLSLFDGHPDIFTSPVHDKLPYQLISYCLPADDVFDIRDIRRSLKSHMYYNIEFNLNRGVVPVLLSSSANDVINVPLDVDFYDLEKKWISRLYQSQTSLCPNDICIEFYSVFSELLEKRRPNQKKYFITMGDPRYQDKTRLLEVYPNSKLIYVRRPYIDICATRITRRSPIGLPKQMFNKNFTDLLFGGEIPAYLGFDKSLLDLTKLYPERVRIVDFNDLVLNTKECVESLSNFLELDNRYIDKLNEPTLNSYLLKNESCSYIGNVNDTASTLMSSWQIKILLILQTALSSFRLKPLFALSKAQSIFYSIFKRISSIS